MNRLENWFCASSFWRRITREQFLPWLLAGAELGDHVLEIGAGAGAATEELRKRAARVTSLEYSRDLLAKLVQRDRIAGEAGNNNGAALQGDAAMLPFPEKSFSAVIAVLVLHHLPSREAQDRAFSESFRVLRPGGVFVALDIENGWFNRVLHIRSTFVPLAPVELPARLGAAGFSGVNVTFRRAGFRLTALRPAEIA
jgi:ubiquinone/menaquinone biosynthesis C-methylase UbiE